MVRLLHVALLVAFAALGGSCAVPPLPEGVPTGWVVLSVVREALDFTTARIRIESVEQGGYARSLGYPTFPDEGERKRHRFGEKRGVVVAERFPAGRYHIVNFDIGYLAGNRNFAAGTKLSVPVEVRANEVVYLGEFVASGTTIKPVILVPQVAKAYFLVNDRRTRDMRVAVEEHPAVAGLPVQTVRVADANSFFRSTPLPD